MSELNSPADVADLVAVIDAALERFHEEHQIVLAVDRGTADDTRWSTVGTLNMGTKAGTGKALA